MLLTIKLVLTPLLIAMITLVGRRWGSSISGWITGLPLISGPVSVFLALQYGNNFAANAATGMIGGIASVGAFCLVYSWIAPQANWLVSVSSAALAFFLATFFWNLFSLTLIPTFFIAVIILALVLLLIPSRNPNNASVVSSSWDIPARMVVATGFIIILTGAASHLGAQLSGLLSPFPIFSTVLAIFTHKQQGPDAVIQFLRGVLFGLFAFACFFLIVGLLLPSQGGFIAYGLAIVAAGVVNAYSLRRVHK